MSTSKECPLLWARTDLDAFLLFEAASRGEVPIFTEEPDVAERERLTRSGQVIIWDEAAVLHPSADSEKLVKTRWHHTVTWSASRMIRNYLTYRQMYPKKGPRYPRARAPDIADEDLEYDLFCAFRDHENFPAEGLMRRTMSLKFNGHELHLINFYEPYSQIDPSDRLPTASSLSQFAKYTYDISPGILRHGHRRPPIINIVRYTQQNDTTGAAELVERPVYGGEWGAYAALRGYHFNAGKKYWAEKLGIHEEELDFFAENPSAAEDRPVTHRVVGRGGKRKARAKGSSRPVSGAAKKKSPAKSKSTSRSPSGDEEPAYQQSQDEDREDPTWAPRSKSNSLRWVRSCSARRGTHHGVTSQAVGPIQNGAAYTPVAAEETKSLPSLTLSPPHSSTSDASSSYSPTSGHPDIPEYQHTIPPHQTVVYPDGSSITPHPNQYTFPPMIREDIMDANASNLLAILYEAQPIPRPTWYQQLHSSYDGNAAATLNPRAEWPWMSPQYSGQPHYNG